LRCTDSKFATVIFSTKLGLEKVKITFDDGCIIEVFLEPEAKERVLDGGEQNA
jgi:hypothetical protein